jgi:5-methylcytosine-specific restriction endonuclease McrA
MKTPAPVEKKPIYNSDLIGLKLVKYRNLGDKFREELILHKNYINYLVKNNDVKSIPAIISSGEELALVYAEFKCECCGNENDLQTHHLIQKNVRPYVNSTKYIAQRYYWANLAILCNVCHAKIHGFSKDRFIAESICMQKQKINKLKELYNLNKVELNSCNENEEIE